MFGCSVMSIPTKPTVLGIQILTANCKWAALQRINYIVIYLTFQLDKPKFNLHNLHQLNFLNFSANLRYVCQQENVYRRY